MASMCGNILPNYRDENSELRLEIHQLNSEMVKLKKEMEEVKKLMSARASFTDFKVFKFNEEEKKIIEERQRARLNQTLCQLIR